MQNFVDQVTLDCLLNKQMYNAHLQNKKTSQMNKEERNFYRKRSFHLFKEMINGNSPEDLPPDVKYAYNNFITQTIQYFKTIDNNDILQSEYKDLEESSEDHVTNDSSYNSSEVDSLLVRSIKIETPTLDKYVKRVSNKKKEEIILPKQKEIDLKTPELKNKGLKKNNIDNMYEDTKKKD